MKVEKERAVVVLNDAREYCMKRGEMEKRNAATSPICSFFTFFPMRNTNGKEIICNVV